MPVSRKSTLKRLLQGLLVSIGFTLLAMLLMAAALLVFQISDRLLHLLNQAVKLAAIVPGVCTAVPRGSIHGLATGLAVALAYSIAGCILYVLLGGCDLVFSAFLGELLLGAAAGAVTGVIRANMQAKKRRLSAPVRK